MTKPLSLSEDELELFARHVSLAEIGAAGQARLLETSVFVGGDVPGREVLLIALSRSGLGLVSDPALAQLRIDSSELSPAGTIDFSAGQVDVGPFDFLSTARIEASTALHIKEQWLGALLASGIVLYCLGQRPVHHTLTCDYPHFSST